LRVLPRTEVAALVAAAAVVAILAWQELTIRYYFHGLVSGLFCAGDFFEPPPPLKATTYLFPKDTGYDGQFYRDVAHDPFFRRGFAAWIDDPRHRYGRIFVPLIAFLAGAGRDGWIDRAYQIEVDLFTGLGVYWCSRYLMEEGLSAWWGLLFVLVPASLASLIRMLVDGPLCALFAGFLYYLRRGFWKKLYAVAVVAPLVRETGLLMAGAVVIAALLARQWKRAAWFATATIPFLLWEGYVSAHTSPSNALLIVERPVIGILERIFRLRDYPFAPSVRLVLWTVDELAILGFIACLAMSGIWLWQHRSARFSPLGISVSLFLLLGCLLGQPAHLAGASGYSRPVSPLLLWLMLEAARKRTWWKLGPPLTMTLSVALYIQNPLADLVRGGS